MIAFITFLNRTGMMVIGKKSAPGRGIWVLGMNMPPCHPPPRSGGDSAPGGSPGRELQPTEMWRLVAP